MLRRLEKIHCKQGADLHGCPFTDCCNFYCLFDIKDIQFSGSVSLLNIRPAEGVNRDEYRKLALIITRKSNQVALPLLLVLYHSTY